jgi:hypothetical protein
VASDNCTVLKEQRYSNFVVKLTLMIEDRLFRDAGLIALKQGTSLEELVREYLENLVAAQDTLRLQGGRFRPRLVVSTVGDLTVLNPFVV